MGSETPEALFPDIGHCFPAENWLPPAGARDIGRGGANFVTWANVTPQFGSLGTVRRLAHFSCSTPVAANKERI
jgi:hypothetical protein